jgi:hypothetical protein
LRKRHNVGREDEISDQGRKNPIAGRHVMERRTPSR